MFNHGVLCPHRYKIPFRRVDTSSFSDQTRRSRCVDRENTSGPVGQQHSGLFPPFCPAGNTLTRASCLLQCLRLLTHSFNNEYNQLCNSISDCKVSKTKKEAARLIGRAVRLL